MAGTVFVDTNVIVYWFDMVRVIDPFASADRTPRQILDGLP